MIMAIFPKVQSPCPYKANLSELMDGSMCRMCQREVIDLNGMSDDDRVALMEGCSEEVCVSYTLPIKQTIAAAMLGAALGGLPAAAQDAEWPEPTAEAVDDVVCADGVEDYEDVVIIVGGIKDKSDVTYIDTEADLDIPELPVTYEDELPLKARFREGDDRS
jgi:predicted Fe-S protein YdhL (DUF1289 family)